MKLYQPRKLLPFGLLLLLSVTNINAAGLNLVTVNQDGKPGGAYSHSSDISANGQFVAFVTDKALLPIDTNNRSDIYVRDIATKRTILVSINHTQAASGNQASQDPVMTPDGRFVLFSSYADDLTENITSTKGLGNIFLRDLKLGTTQLVNVNKAGKASPSNFLSNPRRGFIPYQISQNGRFVTFASTSSDLVSKDTNNTEDIFVRDLGTKTTKLVSSNRSGTDSGNGRSYEHRLSANGRFVEFYSAANNLVANDKDKQNDFFVRDLTTGKTILMTYTLLDLRTGIPSIPIVLSSNDGRYAAIETDNRLLSNDTNKTTDIYLQDRLTGKLKLVSISSTGKAFGDTHLQYITPNGRYIMFYSFATDLKAYKVYRRDVLGNKTTLISINKAGKAIGGTGFLLSDNGQTALFMSDEKTPPRFSLFIRNLVTNKTTPFVDRAGKIVTRSDIGNFTPPGFRGKITTLSSDGRFLIFSSGLASLAAKDNNFTTDVFVKDLKTGLTKLISTNKTSSGSGNRASYNPILSANGRVVLFASDADDLVANDARFTTDYFTYRIR